MEAKEFYQMLLLYRDIEIPCNVCNGLGVKTYGDTSTWHHGIGGQMITSDVCDACWGSGDKNRHWANLRQINSVIGELKQQIKVLQTEKINHA